MSSCSYTTAVDSYGVAVCADWTQINLPPDGAPCGAREAAIADFQCHLGYSGAERVCEFEQCLTGCHENLDCPEGESCTVGMPGQCG
jgi:hypothetical protein